MARQLFVELVFFHLLNPLPIAYAFVQELRICGRGPGSFCVRRSKSSDQTVVLVLVTSEGMNHYQFKRGSNGQISILLGTVADEGAVLSFKTFEACLEHYIALDPSKSGLACKPRKCILVPHGLSLNC